MIIEREEGNGWNEPSWYWSVRDSYDDAPEKLTTGELITKALSERGRYITILAAVLDQLTKDIKEIDDWRRN